MTELPMPVVDGVAHRFESIDGARIHIAEKGAGPELVLLHGWPQHWFAWRALIGPLSQQFRVICPDIRGLGWSEGHGDDWSLDRLAKDVTGLMDTLGIERVRLVGHDWGAVIGYRLALTVPRRVERFMPLSAVHVWSAIGGPLRQWTAAWYVLANAIAARPMNRWMRVPESRLRVWRHAGSFTPAETEMYAAHLRLPQGVHATRCFYRNMVLREVPWALREAPGLRLSVPTLHLNGAEDPLTRGASDSWRKFADAMQLEELVACGHFIPEELPDVLVQRVLEFMR